MAKLVLSFDGNIVKEYELDKEIYTIGRKSENDIHIDNLAVSSHHAKILTILKESFIEDLDSTNGVFVNGNKISKHALQNGESITVGKHKLKYINTSVGDGENDFESTMVIDPNTEETVEKSVDKIAADFGSAKLQLVSGSNTGKELRLTKILTTLGQPDVQVAAITRRPTGYFLIVVDAGKDNKMPLINDNEINKQQLLADGDIIEVAGVKMRFTLT